MANQLKYVFRLTHIDNIQHVLSNGLVRVSSPLRSDNYLPIGDSQVIKIRGNREVDGYRLSEYVPFYFGPRSPMLYVIQHGYNGVRKEKPENIVYCVVRINDLVANNVDCVFTDGHAISSFTRYYGKERLSDLDSIVSYKDVYSTFWNVEDDPDLKRRKEAELLIKGDLPIQYVCGYVVYNEMAKDRLVGKGVAAGQIAVKPGYYF